MLRNPRRLAFTYLAMLFLVCVTILLSACAARGVRNQTRVGVLTVKDAVVAIDTAEREVAAANVPGYDAPTRAKVNAAIVKLATAEKAYAQVAISWKEGQPIPATVAGARQGIQDALTTLRDALPQIEAVRGPLLKAIDVLQAALAQAFARNDVEAFPVQAALPLSLPAAIQLLSLIGNLVTSGRATLSDIKADLQKRGATDEELDAVIDDMDGIIERRTAPDEQAG